MLLPPIFHHCLSVETVREIEKAWLMNGQTDLLVSPDKNPNASCTTACMMISSRANELVDLTIKVIPITPVDDDFVPVRIVVVVKLKRRRSGQRKSR